MFTQIIAQAHFERTTTDDENVNLNFWLLLPVTCPQLQTFSFETS